jgi:flagellar protein FliS
MSYQGNPNPYQAYNEGRVFSETPLNLVVALYQGAIDSTRQAARCLAAREIVARGKAINKTLAILTELIASLDHAKGGEISRNLHKLYSYMQSRLLEAHMKQQMEPLEEVTQLLGVLLEGWEQAVRQQSSGDALNRSRPVAADLPTAPPVAKMSGIPVYGGYFEEIGDARVHAAYSF